MRTWLWIVMILVGACPAMGQLVLDEVRIGRNQGGLGVPVPNQSSFGLGIANLGDVDGDGVSDMAVGMPNWTDRREQGNPIEAVGQVLILLMNNDRTVKTTIPIRDSANGFGGPLSTFDFFGEKLAALGDLDGDKVPDLAVGAPTGSGAGTVYILFLRPDGTVKTSQRLPAADLGIVNTGRWGRGMSSLGDEDGDGTVDLMVGTRNRVYRLSLNGDGTPADVQRLYQDADSFGYAMASLGDLDGNGVVDLAVGAPQPFVGGGYVVLLFRDTPTTVGRVIEIDASLNGLFVDSDAGELRLFGLGLATVDLDQDQRKELLIGAANAGGGLGVVWVLRLAPDGQIEEARPITNGGLVPASRPNFGAGIEPIGDVDQNGVADIAVGAIAINGGPGQVRQMLLGCGPDCDSDGAGNECRAFQDCDQNGTRDVCEVADGQARDCNADGILDICQVFGAEALERAVVFSGLGSTGLVPSHPALRFSDGSELTLEVCVRPNADATNGQLLRKNNEGEQNYGLALVDGAIEFAFRSTSGTLFRYRTGSGLILGGKWQHITLTHTYGTEQTSFYVNGISVPGAWDSAPLEPPATTGSSQTLFLAIELQSAVDELRIWDRVRSASEVRAAVRQPVDPNTPGLAGYWRFDEGGGTTSMNLVGSGDMDLFDVSWIAPVACPPCDGDVNQDGVVTLGDLAGILAQYERTGIHLSADVNEDGQVNAADLQIVLMHFGERCW